jgi:molybdenum cofactor cytidylyltransferase
MVAAIVLAAGRSTRTGPNKLLLPLANGSAVIRTTMERLARARQHGLNDIVAVLGHEADLIKHELAGLPVRTVVNQRFLEGMSSSLKAGVRAMRRDAEAAMIVLGDQPLLSQAVIAAGDRGLSRDCQAGRGSPVRRGPRPSCSLLGGCVP